MTNKNLPLPAILRQDAWAALKATWKTVLACSAIINLASWVLNQIIGAIPVVGAYLGFLVTAVMTVPMMGVTSGVLGHYRGQPLTHDCLKSMFPHWQKAILLYLWEMLCIVAWMLLSMLISLIVSVVLVLVGVDMENGVAELWMVIVTLVLMLVLAFRAALNYSAAQCIFIDDPSTGVRDVLKQSKAMMHGYRWYSVKLEWPALAIIFAAGFIISGLAMALPAWLGSILSAVLSCFSAMLGYYFMPLMYHALRRIGR